MNKELLICLSLSKYCKYGLFFDSFMTLTQASYQGSMLIHNQGIFFTIRVIMFDLANHLHDDTH